MGIPRIFPLSVLWTSLVMAGCGTSPVLGTGSLSVQLHWPQPGFQTLVIPPATDRIDLRVEASGLPALQAVLRRQDGPETRWQQTLAAGEKRVTARALSADGTVLAEAETRVTVQVGQSAQAVLDLEPVAAPSAQPSASDTDNDGPDNNGPDNPEPNNPDPMATASPEPNASPSPEVSASPEPENSPSPSPTASPRNSGGGGGGGGGGGSDTTPVLTPIVADPAVLSGMGFPTYLTTTVNVANPSPSEFNWTCQEVDETNTTVLETNCPGSSFSPATAPGPEVYWTAPGNDTIGSISLDGNSKYYRITVAYSNSGGSDTQSILITVPIGGGNVYPIGGQN